MTRFVHRAGTRYGWLAGASHRTGPHHNARASAGAGFGVGIAPDVERLVPLTVRLDLARTLGIHRRGLGDPTMRLEPGGVAWRATWTPDGPATVRLAPAGDALRVLAWGPGAGVAAAGAEALAGLDDPAETFVPAHPVLAEAARRLRGLRFGRTGAVLEALVPAILEQKVTGEEARAAWRAIVRRHGEPAPGPGGLVLPVEARVLAALPYHAFHPLGLERRRAGVISAVAREAPRLERLAAAACAAGPAGDPALRAALYAALVALPGIGPWTAAEVGARALGDADAVSVGDFHLPHLVAWALAGEPRGSDERMLELLAPYAGHRGRVTRLLELAGPKPARRAPRMAPRRIAGI